MSKTKKTLMKDPESMGPKHESLIPFEVKNALTAKLRDKLAYIESTNGENTDHPVIASGIHEGQHAVGSYGLMPKTIKEFSIRMIRDGETPLAVKRIKNMEDEQKAADIVAADPELENLYVEKGLDHVIKRQNGDMDRAAYSWERGHNLAPDQITDDALDNSEYVQKFRKLGEKLYGRND